MKHHICSTRNKRKWKFYFVAALISSPLSLFAAQTDQTSVMERAEIKKEEPRKGRYFAEPLIQYSQADSEIKTSQRPQIAEDTSGTSRGYGLGIRLGGQINDVVFLAADGRYTRTTFDDSAYGKVDGNSWNLGPSVGAQIPQYKARVWGTYVAGGEYDPDSGASRFDVKFRDARGWRAGLGWKLPALSLNLEYEDVKYDTSEIQNFGQGGDTNVDFNAQATMLSMSFPLQF